MGLRARLCYGLCILGFVALNVRLLVRMSSFAPFQGSRHSAFTSSLEEPAATTNVYIWCKDVVSNCTELSYLEQCNTNSTVREQLCKESCGECSALSEQVMQSVHQEVLQLTEPFEFICKNTRHDCNIPGYELQCEAREPETVAGCKATCGYCNATSFAGFNPMLRCSDLASACPMWAQAGLCGEATRAPPPPQTSPQGPPRRGRSTKLNPPEVWMARLCRASCGLCSAGEVAADRELVPVAFLQRVDPRALCRDYHLDCAAWKDKGACDSQRNFMSTHCPLTCGMCSTTASDTNAEGVAIDAVIPRQALPKRNVGKQFAKGQRKHHQASLAAQQRVEVLQRHFCPPSSEARCAEWAADQCEANVGYMAAQCANECGFCDTVWRRKVPRSVRVGREAWTMPMVGLGTAGMGEQTKEAVLQALHLGYRHIDTAQATEWYREDLVGEAIQESRKPRSNLFITTKLHPRDHGYNSTLTKFEESLQRLRTEYVDLFLLHYPKCWGDLCGGVQPQGPWQDSWKALVELKGQGKIRAIGVSNFNEVELVELLRSDMEKPAVVQAHSDLLAPNWALQALCRKWNITFTAYSSLGTQWLRSSQPANPVLTHPAVQKLAKRHRKSPAQVLLQWQLQHDMVVIPRSTNREHQLENLRRSFLLGREDMLYLDQASRLQRTAGGQADGEQLGGQQEGQGDDQQQQYDQGQDNEQGQDDQQQEEQQQEQQEDDQQEDDQQQADKQQQ